MTRRPTSAVINTESLRHNYRQIRDRISGTTKIMAVVKANAYGHGDVEVARVLESIGCEFFGVAIPEEGAKLRANGIIKPIVVLGGLYRGQVEDIFKLELTPVVFDMETARLIDAQASLSGRPKKIHVKIDTGMSRLGVLSGDALEFFRELKALKNLSVEGILSHFVESESEDRSYTREQLRRFVSTVEAVKGLGFSPELIDMANSAAAADFPEAHLNLVRPGLMLYGSYPAAGLREKIKLRPVMELKTEVMLLKKIPAGSTVSYGRTFTAGRETVIATLPIGYADGLPRRLSGAGEVLIRGKRAPIAGRVCMDLTMCDATGIESVKAGDEAVIIGSRGDETITAEEVAERAGTISYEVFCNISSRVPRVYI